MKMTLLYMIISIEGKDLKMSNKSYSQLVWLPMGEAGLAYPSGAPDNTPVFDGGRVAKSLVYYVVLWYCVYCCVSFFRLSPCL